MSDYDKIEETRARRNKYGSAAFFISGLGISALYLGFKSQVPITAFTGYFTTIIGGIYALPAIDAWSDVRQFEDMIRLETEEEIDQIEIYANNSVD